MLNLAKMVVSVLHKVVKLKYQKLEVLQQRIKNKVDLSIRE